MIETDMAGRPDPLGDYASAFAVGRRMAGRPASAPDAPQTAGATAGDPRALLAALPTDRQQDVARRLQMIAGIARAIGAASPDPLQRARLAQHFAQMHPGLGISPEQLTPEVMTDENLAQLQALAAPVQAQTASPSPATHAARGFTILGVE